MWSKAVSCGRGLLEIVYPRHCVSCGEVVEASDVLPHVCGECYWRVKLIEAPKCRTCGYPFYGETDSSVGCEHCRLLRPDFGEGWSVALFKGPVRELIHALKYENGVWALRDIAAMAAQAREGGLGEYARGASLIPVPLHARKERERGYNQSEKIAVELCKTLPVKGMEILLERVIDTESQTKFGRQERHRNLRNAFSLRRKGVIDPKNRYLIIDDVFTTGSTLNACASVLRKAGARRIDVLTIGHG
ncbi:MAG: ComF family protein [Verrucomicrobiota bacterium]